MNQFDSIARMDQLTKACTKFLKMFGSKSSTSLDEIKISDIQVKHYETPEEEMIVKIEEAKKLFKELDEAEGTRG